MTDLYAEIMKDVPIGNDDFKDLRDNDGYYVDKTKLIEEILSRRNTKVFLFTRPRRFGKTLNMSMLDAFFNMKYKGRAEAWFKDLRISRRKDLMAKANDNPVISISLKGLEAESYERFERLTKNKLKRLYGPYSDLRNSDRLTGLQKSNLVQVLDDDFGNIDPTEAIFNLSEILYAEYGKKCIILIDEYDSPMNNAYGTDVQDRIVSFMRGLMTNALKTNEYLDFGVVTGVMQVAKESIFSGLNNLYVNNVLSTDFDEEYGFTESEVREMLSYYGHPEKFEEVKDWYDGYRFGNAEIYNPWSLLNYVAKGFRPAPYWAGTSGNDIIDKLVENSDDDTWEKLIALGNGNSIEEQIIPTVTIRDIGERGSAIYSVLVMSGYLNAVESGDLYDLSIPNNEMRSIYLTAISDRLSTDSGVYFKRVFDAMREAKTENVESTLFDLMAKKIPFFAISKESDYQKILAVAAMCTQGKYNTTMEEESGNGRVDIKMVSKDNRCPHIVMELKRTDSNDPAVWKKEAEDAISQILDKKYHHGLTGRILLYGICFHGKKATAVSMTV